MKNPKKLGAWSTDSKCHVAYMDEGDFYGNEKTIVMDKDEYGKLLNLLMLMEMLLY